MNGFWVGVIFGATVTPCLILIGLMLYLVMAAGGE